MRHYPILFTFIDKVAGNGFVANVTVRGRALAADEEDGAWWLYGVKPGGLAAGGASLAEAQAEFRKEFTAILFDIADGAKNPASFEAEVHDFFEEINLPAANDWQSALSWVRATLKTSEGAAQANPEGLPVKLADDSPSSVEVRVLQWPTPKDNVLDAELALAA